MTTFVNLLTKAAKSPKLAAHRYRLRRLRERHIPLCGEAD